VAVAAKEGSMKPFLIAVLIVAAVAEDAFADTLYPAAIVLEPGYASGPPEGFPFFLPPDEGDPLVIYARVASCNAPFTDLLPAPPYEITCVFTGSTCTGWGMWDDLPCAGGIFGWFEGGTLAFYLDTTPDADFTSPQTFLDGELVLLATTALISVLDAEPQQACPPRENDPDMVTYLSFLGGTWFPRVSDHGTGLAGNGAGELDDVVPAVLTALGYIFRVDGTFDVYGPVATKQTTWGAVKAMYR